jgi:hypothetical protein
MFDAKSTKSVNNGICGHGTVKMLCIHSLWVALINDHLSGSRVEDKAGPFPLDSYTVAQIHRVRIR